MADFKTHVSFSSILGVGYAASGVIAGFSPSTALVAGGLCGVSGMLPDIDSDSGVPRREAMGFAAAIVPMLLVSRLQSFQLQHDQMVLVAAMLYYLIRFVAARMIGRFSVHRGMFHSIPAALIFAGLAFLIAGGDDVFVRYYKAAAVFVGCMSHLILDEIYSVDTRGVVPKFKKSFGTAVKLFGRDGWANFSTYAKLAVVGIAILGDQAVSQRIEQRNPELAGKIRGYQERFLGFGERPIEEENAPADPSQAYAAHDFENRRPAPPSNEQPAYQQQPYQQPANQRPVYSDPRQQAYAYDQRSRQPAYDRQQYNGQQYGTQPTDNWQRAPQSRQDRGWNDSPTNGFEANRPRGGYSPPSPNGNSPNYRRPGYNRGAVQRPSYETARRGVSP